MGSALRGVARSGGPKMGAVRPIRQDRIGIRASMELAAAPGVRLRAGGAHFLEHFVTAGRVGRATGNLAFDTQIAAICREHGISRLLTRDRDFSRFPWLRIVDLDDDPKDNV